MAIQNPAVSTGYLLRIDNNTNLNLFISLSQRLLFRLCLTARWLRK